MLDRRRFLVGLSAAGALSGTAQGEQIYPAGKTIRMIVPFAAGGSTDIAGRILADRLAIMWSTTIVVENIGGAGANIGNNRAAKAAPDGSTILIATPSLATNQFLYERMSYDPESDFVPLSLAVLVPNVVIARKDLPANSIGELIAYAKANPAKLTYAHSGVGTSGHLSAELFKRMTDIEIRAVAYRSGAPALNDILSGSVDLNFANLSSVIEQIRAGAVKTIGISTATRSALAPELTPIAETVPDFESSAWFGVAMRSGTPLPILTKVEADVRTVVTEPRVRKRLIETINEPMGSSAADFAAFIRRERERFGPVIRDLKLRVD